MTVPPHIRVVARGAVTVVGNHAAPLGEEWSCSFKFSDGGDGLEQGAQASDVHVENIYGIWANYMLGLNLASNVNVFQISAYRIKADGRMEGNPNIFIKPGGSEAFGSIAPKYPLQVALVVSTVAANRGPARFGRFFLPAPQMAMGADMRLSQADTAELVASVTTMLKLMSDEVDLAGTGSSELVNISAKNGGVQQTVDHIRIGRVFDTHRSRRAQLDEDYQSSGHIDW